MTENREDSYSGPSTPIRLKPDSRYHGGHCWYPLDHRAFSNEDLLARYYIPHYSLDISDTPGCGTVGGEDGGGVDIETSSWCKQWRSLNGKEESEKSDEEEVHDRERF